MNPPQTPASGSSATGPLLYLQGAENGQLHLAVLIITLAAGALPTLRTAEGPIAGREVGKCGKQRVLRYPFSLRMNCKGWYEVDGVRFEVNTALNEDLRIAFVSCNGQEHGDRRRTEHERNVMWRRLARQHVQEPFHLLLHGGDQIYADELLASHPLVREWADTTSPPTTGVEASVMQDVVEELREAFFRRYMEVLGQPEISWLMARIPSLAIWDDHDICDGWGSIQIVKLDSPIARSLFAVARQHFLLFQLGAAPGSLPAICLDSTGTALSWHVQLPQLHLIAPDLRSERRPDRVMGEAGWRALENALGAVDSGRVLLLSSVPALGPRLSWIERLMHLTPGMEKYEDDLRDQWQSRTHRAEWRRFLERLTEVHGKDQVALTVLSGEIHLATRGTFEVLPAPMHQLIASGISHPAPPEAYAKLLGLLARFGDSPIPGHPIRLHPLPGHRGTYVAERNYLILERRRGEWHVWWELEKGGPTPALRI